MTAVDLHVFCTCRAQRPGADSTVFRERRLFDRNFTPPKQARVPGR
jgi:hypothetical protein